MTNARVSLTKSLSRGAAALSILLTVGAGISAAQETWAPVIVFDGVDIWVNGEKRSIVNGPVEPITPIYSSWDVSVYGNAPFLYPNGITENPLTDEWIVADTYHGRLLRFATDRHPTAVTGTFLGPLPTSINYEVSSPYGPIVDDEGTILVADYDAKLLVHDVDAGAVKVFVPDGNGGYTASAIWSYTDAFTNPASPQVVRFSYPQRLAFLPDPTGGMNIKDGVGSLVVLDSERHRVLILTCSAGPDACLTGTPGAPQWSLALAFGGNGVGPGKFNYPTGLATDGAGHIYVSDPNNATTVTIQVFDSLGRPEQTISEGLSAPWSLTIGPDGRLFVADTGNNRIAVFDKFEAGSPTSLAPLTVRIGSPSQPLGGLALIEAGLPLNPVIDGDLGVLQEPTPLAFDQQGRLLVADTDNFRIQIFNKAHLSVSAIADPQTVPGAALSVEVLVSVTLPPGETIGVTNVIPATPTVSFSMAGGPGSAVVDAMPSCVQIRPSTTCVALPIAVGQTLDVGGQLDYVFTFDKILGSVGPVWFSVNASGLQAGTPVVSGTAQTYAVAIDSSPPASPPTISASLANSANGWFKTQPVLVDLTASVAANSGGVQEIEYALGPTPPLEGDFNVCYNVFTSVDEFGNPLAPSCSIPVFKEGVTKLWYRALSSRGLYDTLVPYGSTSISVPGWSEQPVKLDFTPAGFEFLDTDANGNPVEPVEVHNGWVNRVPVTVHFKAFDTGSSLESVTVENVGPAAGHTLDPDPAFDVPYAWGTLTFGADGLYDVTMTAVDRVGNDPGVVTRAMRIDATPPVVYTIRELADRNDPRRRRDLVGIADHGHIRRHGRPVWFRRGRHTEHVQPLFDGRERTGPIRILHRGGLGRQYIQ